MRGNPREFPVYMATLMQENLQNVDHKMKNKHRGSCRVAKNWNWSQLQLFVFATLIVTISFCNQGMTCSWVNCLFLQHLLWRLAPAIRGWHAYREKTQKCFSCHAPNKSIIPMGCICVHFVRNLHVLSPLCVAIFVKIPNWELWKTKTKFPRDKHFLTSHDTLNSSSKWCFKKKKKNVRAWSAHTFTFVYLTLQLKPGWKTHEQKTTSFPHQVHPLPKQLWAQHTPRHCVQRCGRILRITGHADRPFDFKFTFVRTVKNHVDNMETGRWKRKPFHSFICSFHKHFRCFLHWLVLCSIASRRVANMDYGFWFV